MLFYFPFWLKEKQKHYYLTQEWKVKNYIWVKWATVSLAGVLLWGRGIVKGTEIVCFPTGCKINGNIKSYSDATDVVV